MTFTHIKCQWEKCEEIIQGTGRKYCKLHRIHNKLRSRIKTGEINKRLDAELRKLKPIIYENLYKDIQKKVLEELNNNEHKEEN